MLSQLSPQWLCGNSCTWVYDVRLHIAGTNEPKSAQETKQELVPAMCNGTARAQVHELPQNYFTDDREVTLFS